MLKIDLTKKLETEMGENKKRIAELEKACDLPEGASWINPFNGRDPLTLLLSKEEDAEKKEKMNVLKDVRDENRVLERIVEKLKELEPQLTMQFKIAELMIEASQGAIRQIAKKTIKNTVKIVEGAREELKSLAECQARVQMMQMETLIQEGFERHEALQIVAAGAVNSSPMGPMEKVVEATKVSFEK